MPMFLFRTVCFFALEHAYLFQRLYALTGKRCLYLAPWFLLMGFFPLVLLALVPDSAAYQVLRRLVAFWQPLAYFGLLVFLARDLARLGAWALRRPPRNSPAGTKRSALLLLAAALIFAYGLYEARHPRLTHLSLYTDKLPPHSGELRLAFVADLHVGAHFGTARLGENIDRILKEQPDLILLGGDILDDAMQGSPEDMAQFARLRAPLGVFAVLGNHDAFGNAARPAALLRQAGLNVLDGKLVKAGPLSLVGVDDPDVSAQRGLSTHDPMPLLRQADQNSYRILLAHRPDIWPQSPGLFDLQLSGHSHGGQIALFEPLMRALYGSPSGLSSHHGNGQQSLLYITNGLGFSKLPIRLGRPPEILMITLARPDAKEQLPEDRHGKRTTHE